MKEQTRDEFRPALLEDFLRDLRYGFRVLLRAPGFAVVSILTLGLGIGAATAVFSVVDGVLLRPLPYPRARQHRAAVSDRRQRRAQRQRLGAELRGLEGRHAELQRDGGDRRRPDAGRRGTGEATMTPGAGVARILRRDGRAPASDAASSPRSRASAGAAR